MRPICYLLLLPILFAWKTAIAQPEQSLFRNNKLKHTGSWVGYRVQLAQYFNQTAQISGFHVQGEFNRRYLIGANYNFISNYVYLAANSPTVVHHKWGGLHLGYRFKPHYVVHPLLEADLGGGTVYNDESGSVGVGVLSPAAGVEFNLTRWMHFTLSGGYRWVTALGAYNVPMNLFSTSYVQFGVRFGRSRDRK